MTAEQIIELSVLNPPKAQIDMKFLIADFALRLEALSHKLTDEEIISLATVAAPMFDRASNEFVSAVSTASLLDNLRRGR